MKRLIEANIAYRTGEPIMSDIEYDNLLEAYIANSNEGELAIRRQLMDIPGKVKHDYMVGSLKKTKAEDESFLDWWMKQDRSKCLIASAKVDGMSLSTKYVNGKMIAATTRGDGEFGENQTEKCRYICPDVDQGFTGTVRGELTLTFETFEKLKTIDTSREHKNPRNSTTGILGHKTCYPELCVLVKFVAYEIVGSDYSREQQFRLLRNMGFEIPSIMSIDPSIVGIRHLVETYNSFAEAADYLVDGLVIHGEDWIAENDKYYPDNARAFKVNDTNAKSRVLNVEWNLGKTGKLTPIVIIDPVELNGTTVQRASAYNASYLIENGIVPGSVVTVQKSGDIIPCIIDVENTGEWDVSSIRCPECGEPVEWDENKTHLICVNEMCSGKINKQLESFIVKIGVEGISGKSLENFGISSFEELIHFKPDPKYKKQVVLRDELDKKVLSAPLGELMSCLTWIGSGRKTINKLIEHYTLQNFFDMMIDNNGFSNLPSGIGEITMQNIVKTFKHNHDLCKIVTSHPKYNPIIKIVSNESNTDKFAGKKYCVTGKTSRKRAEIQNYIKENGGKISSISKSLDLLIVGDKPGPAKLKKCEDLRIEIITEEEFYDL